jgi:hypothetical protein
MATTYYVSYQSIIEHVISEDIFIKIINGEIDHIPAIAVKGIVAPLNLGHVDPEAAFPNETITESILKRIFLKTGRLFGENGYLCSDIQESEIIALQMEVLAVADTIRGPKYEHLVKGWLALGNWHQQQVFTRIIRPASKIGAYFNPRWLHAQIISMPSVYERDKFLWADRATRNQDNYVGLEAAIYPFQGYDTSLYPFDHFDQEPIIYAWCLSSPNRSIRKQLRSSLLNWGNLNVAEWIKLLGLMMNQKDSQIWEDLAAINLGLSVTLKTDSDIELLAKWTLNHIFANLDTYQSSRVREGFRGIVDRATNLGLVSLDNAGRARPQMRGTVLLPLASDVLDKRSDQFFPVISDLAWYVLDNSYEDFLDEAYQSDADQQPSQQLVFLEQYALVYKLDSLSPMRWAQAAVIALIREKFDYSEKSGNLAFLPSHGEKGLIMYFAEKYVWQAVYSLQGYLSEQLPILDKGRYLKSYREIINIPNPAEGDMHNGDLLSKIDDIPGPGWCIPENLVNSVTKNPRSIKMEIEGSDDLNLLLWLDHTGKDGRKWQHLYSKTTLEDKNQVVYGRLTVNAVLMRPDAFLNLLELARTSPEEIYFLSSLDTLLSTPSGSFYQNPSDVVDGKDIDEDESDSLLEIDGEESNLYHSIIKVVQSENNDERTHYLPSKLLREITDIRELKGKRLKNHRAETIGFVSKMEDLNSENEQILTCIDADLLGSSVATAGYQMIWFMEVFKRTTLSAEKDDLFLRRTRKYMVWLEAGIYKSVKFWDKESSN